MLDQSAECGNIQPHLFVVFHTGVSLAGLDSAMTLWEVCKMCGGGDGEN